MIKSNKARSRPDRNYQFPITYIYIHGHVYSGIVQLIIKFLASCIFYINVIFEQKKQYLCGKAITSHCMKTKSCAKSFAFELGTPVNYMQNYQNGKFLPPPKKFKLNLNMIDKSIKHKCNVYDHSYIFDGILGKCVPFSNSKRGFDNFKSTIVS